MFLSEKTSSIYSPAFDEKIACANPSCVLGYYDYDLTLADKLPEAFDEAPLKGWQHEMLARSAQSFGKHTVVTARGEKTALRYLTQHGVMPNTALASNSGHIVLDRISPVSPRYTIKIPGYAKGELPAVVAKGIFPIIDKLHQAFPELLAKRREICGAVVHQFPGNAASDKFRKFQDMALSEREKLPEDIRNRIIYAAKYREIEVAPGQIETQGYIDMKPTGMDKGYVVTELFKRQSAALKGAPFVIVAGDSEPDFAMMQAIDKLVPETQRLFISVGEGLLPCDQKNYESTGKKLLDVALKGPEAVSNLHRLVGTLSGAAFTPSC